MESIVSYVNWLIGGDISGTPYMAAQMCVEDTDAANNGSDSEQDAVQAPEITHFPRRSVASPTMVSPGATEAILLEKEYGISLNANLLKEDQLLMDTELISTIHAAIPARWRMCTEWRLLYSAASHGYSLNTLFHSQRCHEGAVVLVISEQCDAGGRFGCFATEPFAPHCRHFGTGECFLFSEDPMSRRVAKYGASGKNDYYLYAQKEYVAMGCGEGVFGVWLDSRLSQGSSKPTPTFDNRQLSTTDPFTIDKIEIWGLLSPTRSPILH